MSSYSDKLKWTQFTHPDKALRKNSSFCQTGSLEDTLSSTRLAQLQWWELLIFTYCVNMIHWIIFFTMMTLAQKRTQLSWHTDYNSILFLHSTIQLDSNLVNTNFLILERLWIQHTDTYSKHHYKLNKLCFNCVFILDLTFLALTLIYLIISTAHPPKQQHSTLFHHSPPFFSTKFNLPSASHWLRVLIGIAQSRATQQLMT